MVLLFGRRRVGIRRGIDSHRAHGRLAIATPTTVGSVAHAMRKYIRIHQPPSAEARSSKIHLRVGSNLSSTARAGGNRSLFYNYLSLAR